jgi:hypothetical protein
MANNVIIPASGTGTATPTVETYDTTGSGGPQRQAVSLASIGAPASVTPLIAGQATSANSIPVVIASDQVPVSLTPGSSAVLEASHVLKASAGKLFSLYCFATSVAGYLLTFNATSAPADGTVAPVECIPVPAGAVGAINFGAFPDAYSTGIVAVFSTSGPFTKAGSATAFFKWRVQ